MAADSSVMSGQVENCVLLSCVEAASEPSVVCLEHYWCWSDYELYDGCQDNVASSRYLTNIISPQLLLTPLNTNTHSAFLTGSDLNFIISKENSFNFNIII